MPHRAQHGKILYRGKVHTDFPQHQAKVKTPKYLLIITDAHPTTIRRLSQSLTQLITQALNYETTDRHMLHHRQRSAVNAICRHKNRDP